MSSAISRRRRRRGAAALEFALTGSAFLLLLFGSFDVARYFFTMQALHTLVSTTARAAMIGTVTAGGTCPGGGMTLPASIIGTVPLLKPSLLCVSVTEDNTSKQNIATVSVQYSFGLLLPIWNAPASTLADSATLTY